MTSWTVPGVLTLTSCPQCGVPAEITERFLLTSTDGPVPHVALACAAGHHFRMAAEGLPGSERGGWMSEIAARK